MAVSKKKDTVFTIPLSSLVRASINPSQWAFCYILHTRDWDGLTSYIEGIGQWLRADVKDLANRGYILHFNVEPAMELSARNFSVTEKFTDLLYGTNEQEEVVDDTSLMVDDDEAFNQLFHAYPPYITISGQGKAPGRTLSFELGAEMYSLATKGKRATHQQVLELLEWGKEQGLITMGLQKFIASRQWLSLQQAKESGELGDIGAFNNDI